MSTLHNIAPVTEPARIRLHPALRRAEGVYLAIVRITLKFTSHVLLAERAQHMRHAATPSEAALWSALRGGALGVQFRRQVPSGGNFIGDFVASEVKLVVEIDGSWHAGRGTADARRDRELQRLGFTVLRLSVTQVERQLPGAVQRIREAIAALRGAP